MIEISIDANGFDFAQLGAELQTTGEEAITEATAILLSRIRARFLSATDADGTAWPVSYAAKHRAKSGRGGKTLFDTGNLFHSIQLYSVSPTERSIGTDLDYGAKHQLGLEGNPVREFLGFNEEDADITLRVLEDLFQEKFT